MQNLGNARTQDQRKNMEALAAAGQCLFCPGGMKYAEQKPVYEGSAWYVKPNDFKYKGALLHPMAIPRRHILTPEELTTEELVEFFHIIIPWLRHEYGMDGCSGLFRFGDTSFTGATIHHLHFHFIRGQQKVEGETEPIWAVVGFQPKKDTL